MSDLIKTLHPQNNIEDNVYPNIIADNIPDSSISSSKLDSTLLTTINNKANSSDISDKKITITQGGITKGSFTLNQTNNSVIALDSGNAESLQWYLITLLVQLQATYYDDDTGETTETYDLVTYSIKALCNESLIISKFSSIEDILEYTSGWLFITDHEITASDMSDLVLCNVSYVNSGKFSSLNDYYFTAFTTVIEGELKTQLYSSITTDVLDSTQVINSAYYIVHVINYEAIQ